jgi:hypothetical protein
MTKPTTTPATTQVSDAMSLSPASKPSTKPTTKPFEDAKEEIIEAMISPEAQKLEATVQSRLMAQMREDWRLYHLARGNGPATGPTTGPTTNQSMAPTTAPASSVGVAYDSPDYLSKLAERMQKDFKVVLTAATLSEKFLTQDDLKALPTIGKTFAQFSQGRVAFAEYATELAEPFVKDKSKNELPLLKVLEPSASLSDENGNEFIFRLSEVDPTHRPADSREVLDKIEEDIKNAAAHELEIAEAKKLLEAAKQSSVSAACKDSGKSATLSDWIHGPLGMFPPQTPVSSLSEATFLEQAYKLLSSAAVGRNTTALIDVPRDHKSFVAQLADVRRSPLLVGAAVDQIWADRIRQELASSAYPNWFKWDSLVARTGYVDASKHKEED